MPGALAFRYARALADVAAADAQRISEDLAAFEQTLAASRHLHIALESPAVPPARKRTVVSHLAKSMALSDVARRFLLVLVDHRRPGLLGEIRAAFQAVVDERLGRVRVEVFSARELAPAQREQIVTEFGRITGKQPTASFSVDAGLIGGALARLGSTVFDGSVRGQLEALKRRMAAAGE